MDDFLEIHVDEAEAISFEVNYLRRPFINGMRRNVPECGKTKEGYYTTYNTYKEYMTYWNNNQIEMVHLHVCKICGRLYRMKSGLHSHLKNYHCVETTNFGRYCSRKKKRNYRFSNPGEEIFARRPTKSEIDCRKEEEMERRKRIAT